MTGFMDEGVQENETAIALFAEAALAVEDALCDNVTVLSDQFV